MLVFEQQQQPYKHTRFYNKHTSMFVSYTCLTSHSIAMLRVCPDLFNDLNVRTC